MDTLQSILRALIDALTTSNNSKDDVPSQRQFIADKPLRERDMIILDMLNSVGHEDVSFCVTDPDQTDCPIIFASDGFCKFTGYNASEIEGQNCRFLQGEGTLKSDVDRIRNAISEQKEASVNLLNYRKFRLY